MNIVQLPQKITPNESTIELLESLLEDAKDGIIQEFHAISITSDGKARITYSPTENITLQIGWMEVLRADLMRRFFGNG